MGFTGGRGGEIIQAFQALAENASAAAAMLVKVTEEPERDPVARPRSRGLAPPIEALRGFSVTAHDSELQRDSDLRLLVGTIDGIIDQAHGIADKAILFGLQDRIHGASELARILRSQTLEIQTAMRAVDQAERLRESCVIVHRLEVEADGVFQEAMRRLFKEEPDPIRLLKAREILESIHQATDACEDAARILETLALR